MGDHLRLADGVKTCESPYGFEETPERVAQAIGEPGADGVRPPLRVLVWEQDERTRVSYQDPGFVSRRFGISAEIPAHAEALVDRALG